MALINTQNFLPEVFRTVTNQRFTGATVDQLVQDSVIAPLHGYIGRTFAPTYKLGDNYVPEIDALRKHYQLESTVVVEDDDKKIQFTAGYLDLLKTVGTNYGSAKNHQRLFKEEVYNYDGKFDYDKFVNYGNYYWMPDGPAAVNIYSNQVPLQATYTVTRNTAVDGYTFGSAGIHQNPQLILARGGIYKFQVDQPGTKFWIQSEPGVTGLDTAVSTISTRDVYGVVNNGDDAGVVQFNVPKKSAQDFFVQMPTIVLPGNKQVDAAVTFDYADIQHILLSEFLTLYPAGLDGVKVEQGKTLVFINNNRDDINWTAKGMFDEFSLDSNGFDSPPSSFSKPVDPSARTGVWQITLIPTSDGEDHIIQLTLAHTVPPQHKVFITSGKKYASHQYWVDNNNLYNPLPLITANAEYLYYQDSNNPNFVGQIKLIDADGTPIDIEQDILGKKGYVSPNGVAFTNGLKVLFDSGVTPAKYANSEYYVEGVGTGIMLVPVSECIVPEIFGSLLSTTADYITINRASQDSNPWSRSNRWFHKDILYATSKYNKTDLNYGPNIAGRRPIIEFDPNLQLFNFGRQHKQTVDLIVGVNPDDPQSDAFNDVEGKITAQVDNVTVQNGQRIIFANDYDNNVKGKIWQVVVERINSTNFIRLIETADDPVLVDENVLITQGSHKGDTYRFDGSRWHLCQAKSEFNQSPMFDLVDKDGYSFADTTVYPASTFASASNNLGEPIGGTQLFGYEPGTGANDVILGFPLQYQNFNNIGDIVFANYYDTDTFTTTVNSVVDTYNCNSGYVVKNAGLTDQTKLNNWVIGVEPSKQYQIFTKFFDGRTISDAQGIQRAFVQLDITPVNESTVPYIKVYLNNLILQQDVDYVVTTYGVYDVVNLLSMPAVGDKIDIAVFSNTASAIGYYEIPINLDLNPLNDNFSAITLGQIRAHYNKLIENLSVNANAKLPLQDVYVKAQGGTLIQHGSPLPYAMSFLNDPSANFLNSITLAKKEYTRFKNKFLSLCTTMSGIDYNDPVTGVDAILQNINLVKNDSFSWYYSDMVPQGGNYNVTTYSVLNARQTQYEISSLFDVTKLSNRAILIYLNGQQLVIDRDYQFSTISPAVNFSIELAFGDTIVIRDYFDTDGCYVPETPTKLGLYPKFEPEIYLDTTYQTPVNVVRGHDGSLTPSFNDFRDTFLLELERRIFNNIKTNYLTNEINLYDTVPGYFRATDYGRDEFDQLVNQSFLQWVGDNKIDYTANTWYDANNSWTWNYGGIADTVTGAPLQGSWRAIYNYWFDTDSPNLRPWEMLGFSRQPAWWTDRYGPAPYTGSNTTLWEDLANGYIWNNGESYTDARFARPGLTEFIPVDEIGSLKSPAEIPLFAGINNRTILSNFSVGQQGPVETAWRRSSDYSYALQIALALARPAQYFSTQIDTSRFYRNSVTGQFSDVANRTLSPMLLKINGNNTTGTIDRTSGYINWIFDYTKNLGIDPVKKFTNYFKHLNMKLAYKIGGYTDKNLLTVSAEQTSPGSTNASVIVPDANYKIHLNKSVPVKTISYSAVIIENVEAGYTVTGYDTANPYFVILPSIANNVNSTITVNDLTVKLYQDSETDPIVIPYGTTFVSPQQVADFLISYERTLAAQGFVFSTFDYDLEEIRNWTLSVKEFLYWAQQGWDIGTIILLNPAANTVSVKSKQMIVDEITNLSNGSRLLDQNYQPIKNNNFNILRKDNFVNGNQTTVTTIGGVPLCYAKFNLIQYEHILILDNVSDFGDIIYVPTLGSRQYRLRLTGSKTGAWTGALDAPGFVYSDFTIDKWAPNTDYKLGDIITYSNQYYIAKTDIAATTTFIQQQWTGINKSELKTGLLPSFGQNAQEFERIYDIDRPPVSENLQTFSAGLIGFRQRPYFTDLGISVQNQTKFYQGFIKQKGTINSVEALTKANFDNVGGSLTTYEEWAFRVGQYGDLDRNRYTEFVLDQSVFTTNPVAFTVTTDTYSTGNIIVNLELANVYTSSNLSSVTSSLYNNRSSANYAKDLPTAGYVNINDIDATVFDLTNNTATPNVVPGNHVWTAKDNNKNWNVFRVTDTRLAATTLTYVLDQYAQLTFNADHSLSVGEYIILKNFNVDPNPASPAYNTSIFDGMYKVVDSTQANSVVIQISNIDNLAKLIPAPVQGNGRVYVLASVRINSVADISSVAPIGGWTTGDRVWIDNSSTGQWEVKEYNARTQAWTQIRSQQPKVDIDSVNRTFIYNRINNNMLGAIDFIDPNKGKILNSIARDIDYQRTEDPALYNAGNVKLNPSLTLHSDYHWGPAQVGKIWWNLDTVRYVDYEQDALIYRLNQWGNKFPGSSIDVYEWVASSVPPSQYPGPGIPRYPNDSTYSTYGYVTPAGSVQFTYYFWVIGKDTVNVAAGKYNSVSSIAAAIENPLSQGVPYAGILRDDTIALYNVNRLLSGQTSVLHLGSLDPNADLVHSEYALIQEGNPDSKIPAAISSKFVDSLAGVDNFGNAVPDPLLPPAQAYGISIRPRQSMIVDRSLALDNYISLINDLLIAYPITQRKVLTTLNSSDPTPNANSGQYDLTVNTVDELVYLDVTNAIIDQYRVLVLEDSTQLGKWVIYTLTDVNNSVGVFTPTQIQFYKTNLYWNYANWYDSAYNSTATPDVTVNNNIEFGKLNLIAGQYIKVLDAGSGKSVVYEINADLTKQLVGIENGTIQISTNSIPGKELRQILLAMEKEIFIEDLAIKYNQVFFSMIKYILSEQKNLDWVFKTSFISAMQDIRKLETYPAYVKDNQDYYLDYINEVKPYRTILREYVVNYRRDDPYYGDVTDFDVPGYWDANLQVYRAPNGTVEGDDARLSSGVYSSWSNNYTYKIVDVVVEEPGVGYTIPPQIIVSGGGGTGANLYSTINSVGEISHIWVDNPGSGYTSAPTIIINGIGSGARAKAVLRNSYDGNNTGHNVVRSIKTNIKFDRINYTNPNTFVFWSNVSSNTAAYVGQTIAANAIIVLKNQLFKLSTDYVITGNAILNTVDFPTNLVHQISADSFDNANDRIVAFNGNVDLKLSAAGMEYPGVRIEGNTFVGTEIDTIIQSRYSDNLGVDMANIYVDGGNYVDSYSSHAPEELVPGRMFDSFDMSIYQGGDSIAWRYFDNMSGDRNYYRIAAKNTTRLAQDFMLTDREMIVDDAAALSSPNNINDVPGVVFVNGEKIIYWRNYALETRSVWKPNITVSIDSLVSYQGNLYLTTGNVYAETFDSILDKVTKVNPNTITRLRRAVDGTPAIAVHSAGSRVVDSSETQRIPGTTVSSEVLDRSTTYQPTAVVAYGITTTGKLSVNVGDIITSLTTVDPWSPGSTVQPGSLVYFKGNSYTATGNVFGPTTQIWQANTTYPIGTYITSGAGDTYITRGNVYTTFFENLSPRAVTYIAPSNVAEAKFGNLLIDGNVSYQFAGNSTISISLKALETVRNQRSFGAIILSGSIIGTQGRPEFYDSEDGFDVNSFSTTSSKLQINGVEADSYIISSYILGSVNTAGTTTVPAGSTVSTASTWYSPGRTGAVTDGKGLYNSTTAQVNFLKESPSFNPKTTP